MHFDDDADSNLRETPALPTRTPFPRRAILPALAAILLAVLAPTLASGVAANNEDRDNRCSERTLRGDYGFLVSGIRGTGPNTTEQFVGSGLRTYDGHGGLTDIASLHGQAAPAVEGEVTGTYVVNANCTGTSTVNVPGLPFPIVSSFVIVHGGRGVREAVMSPQPNIVTAVFEHK